MTRLALILAALLFTASAFAGSDVIIGTHFPDGFVPSGGPRIYRAHRHRHCRYDGPRSDYSTRWYGENAGTVHYGY